MMYGPSSTPEERFASDTLSEETRKQRRNLNLVAVLGLIVVALDLVPTEVTAVGVTFDEADQRGFLWLLIVFDVAFLVLFLIYAGSDFARRRLVAAQVEGDDTAIEDQRQERLSRVRAELDEYEGASDQRRQEIATDVEAQVNKLATLRRNAQTRTTLRSLGRLRFVADYVMPVVLGVSAAALLLIKVVT